METAIKKDKKGELLTPELVDGPMMEYNPWTDKERKEMADWVARHKLENSVNQRNAKHEQL